jgi:hypothetical protein
MSAGTRPAQRPGMHSLEHLQLLAVRERQVRHTLYSLLYGNHDRVQLLPQKCPLAAGIRKAEAAACDSVSTSRAFYTDRITRNVCRMASGSAQAGRREAGWFVATSQLAWCARCPGGLIHPWTQPCWAPAAGWPAAHAGTVAGRGREGNGHVDVLPLGRGPA